MKKNLWLIFMVLGFLSIGCIGIFQQVISFNNSMVALQEMKKAEIETTKVEYGQCVVAILETNQTAKLYHNDVIQLADKAGSNLAQFNQRLLALNE